MTPEEKAKELIGLAEKCQWVDAQYPVDDYTSRSVAIMACVQVMSSVIKDGHEYQYWKEVKEILEKQTD